jgi:polar amino acid transport system substrate-binding protein
MKLSHRLNGKLCGLVIMVGACAALSLLAAGDAAARTLAEVKSLGAISMCANDNALPYASKDPAKPGFQIELGRAIAEGLGLPLNVEWIFPRRRANIVNCDLMFDNANDPKMYEGRLLLTHPYQKSGVALGFRADAEPITDFKELKKGQKIGVMINSIAAMVLGKAGKTFSPYAFQSDMLEDLQKGEIYGAAISSAMMSYEVFQHPDSGLRVVNAFDSEPMLAWEVSVGLRKSDQALLDAINGVLDKLLEDGTVTRIYAKYGVEHRKP